MAWITRAEVHERGRPNRDGPFPESVRVKFDSAGSLGDCHPILSLKPKAEPYVSLGFGSGETFARGLDLGLGLVGASPEISRQDFLAQIGRASCRERV